jgi:hypothetical protein
MADTEYAFAGGYPTPATVQRAYDDADLNRAVQAYRFFFPTVSGLAIFKGNQAVGVIPNRVFARFATEPEQVGFTLNSDTPYGPIPLDLRDGPMVIEVPPGPLICVAFDLNQRWVADMGVPGPDAGNGGRHLLLPPDWDGQVPDGYFVARSTTYRVLAGVRSLPVGGDVQAANDRIPTLKVHPLDPPTDWTEPTWLDLSGQPQDTTPVGWETTLEYWRALHEVVDTEPHLNSFGPLYGELAARSGSSRPSGPHRPCSAAPPGPGRCTGWGCATPTAPIWMAPEPTGWPCPSRCRASCSGRSRSMTPRPAARSAPTRTRPPCGRCSSWPTPAPTRPWSYGSVRRPLRERRAAGSRRSPAGAGSCTSASTARATGLRWLLAAPRLRGRRLTTDSAVDQQRPGRHPGVTGVPVSPSTSVVRTHAGPVTRPQKLGGDGGPP